MGYGLISDLITGQLMFIQALRGLTAHLASFDRPGFGEHEFEQRLDHDPHLAAAKFRYWVRKLQAHLFAGDYASAAAAAAQVQDARWRSQSFFEVAEYPFYSALALAGLYPSASTDDSAADRLDSAAIVKALQAISGEIVSEARRSVHALRPQALEEVNFWQALKGMVKSTTVGTLLQTRFEAKGKVPILPPAWQENLLRIGQEALSNTLKYAHARQFRTRLTSSAKELRLDLCDDGDGFRVRERHDGVGLTGMRERVQEMGGKLKIVSSRGKGTKIAVILPKDAVRQPAVQAKIPRTNTSLVKNPAL
jgi:two-component sensor histidine kinase